MSKIRGRPKNPRKVERLLLRTLVSKDCCPVTEPPTYPVAPRVVHAPLPMHSFSAPVARSQDGSTALADHDVPVWIVDSTHGGPRHCNISIPRGENVHHGPRMPRQQEVQEMSQAFPSRIKNPNEDSWLRVKVASSPNVTPVFQTVRCSRYPRSARACRRIEGTWFDGTAEVLQRRSSILPQQS